jgi:transcriptional regulator NrdR family protein
MKCTKCGSVKTRVVESRNNEECVLRRRRICLSCGVKFTTREITEDFFTKYKKIVITINKMFGDYLKDKETYKEIVDFYENSIPTEEYLRNKNTERLRDYRKTKTGKIAVNKTINKYLNNNPDRAFVYSRIKNLKIEKKPCIICGETKNVHKHHPDITKIKDFVFLCPLHHRQIEMGKINLPIEKIDKM